MSSTKSRAFFEPREYEASLAIGIVVQDEDGMAEETVAEVPLLALELPGLQELVRHRVVMDEEEEVGAKLIGPHRAHEQAGSASPRDDHEHSPLEASGVLGAKNEDTYSRLNGQPAVVIGIYLSPGANAIRTAAAVNATLEKVRARFPDGLQARVPYDSTTFVRDTIKEVIKTLFEAFALVAIVVFLLLGSLRAAIVPVIAVPVSLIGAFLALTALGYSANTVSLLAMVLAIVVVENVERVMEEEPDLSPAGAAKKAMTQVTAPIIAITLVLLSVFVPVGFIAGISGVLFQQFAATIISAMLISAFNGLTLSPALCAVFLRRRSGPRRGFMALVSRGIDGVRDGYGLVVGKIVRLGSRCRDPGS